MFDLWAWAYGIFTGTAHSCGEIAQSTEKTYWNLKWKQKKEKQTKNNNNNNTNNHHKNMTWLEKLKFIFYNLMY